MTGDVLMQAPSFAPQDESGRGSIVHAIITLLAALIESVDPVPALLQIFQCAIDIGHANDGKVGQRASGSTSHRLGQTRSAPFRNHNGRGARGVRRANDRSQIVRILDAVEHHVQTGAGGGLFERRVSFRGSECDHALMRGASGDPVQLRSRFETDWNAALAAEIDELLKTRSAGSFDDENPIEWNSGAKCLPDGMDSCQQGH